MQRIDPTPEEIRKHQENFHDACDIASRALQAKYHGGTWDNIDDPTTVFKRCIEISKYEIQWLQLHGLHPSEEQLERMKDWTNEQIMAYFRTQIRSKE